MRQPQIKRSPSKTKKYTYPFYIKCKFSLAFIYFYKDTKRGKIDFKKYDQSDHAKFDPNA